MGPPASAQLEGRLMNPRRLEDLRANLHPFASAAGAHLYVADGSRIYDIPQTEATALARLLADGAAAVEDEPANTLSDLLLPVHQPRRVTATTIEPPPLQSLSLNVAQACNMSCGYCYADQGTFGGDARVMTNRTAVASIDRLLAEAAPGADLLLGFMGGEPLLNRPVLHDATRYAFAAAQRAGRNIRFSVTTNGTLLNEQDVRLFAEFPFTVTISVDGPPAIHRRLRMLNAGGDAYTRLVERLDLFAVFGRPAHLSARVTVTPLTGDIVAIVDHVLGLGFDEVGVSPVLVSPAPELAFSEAQFSSFLAQMVACGTVTLAHLCEGRPYPFGNFETAMHEIHRGTHRPYPCGAGAAYLSVNADGDLFACHRLVDDPEFAFGSVWEGLDQPRRAEHLRTSHVDRADPCRSCWARYLCGGGCYHEVTRRGRIACDYIRGWLHFCLEAYVQLATRRPEYFDLQPVTAAAIAEHVARKERTDRV
jgi:uncharacterized protein